MAILFMIILPNHHHPDDVEHSDCTVCVIAHQPNLAAVDVIDIVSIAILLFSELVFPVTILFDHSIESFQSRAPPSMNFSY